MITSTLRNNKKNSDECAQQCVVSLARTLVDVYSAVAVVATATDHGLLNRARFLRNA